MTVEDELRTTMRAHDDEAPTRTPWPAPADARTARRRPTTRFALAVAMVTVLVAGGTWLAMIWPRTASRTMPAAPLTCPVDRDTQQSPGVPSSATVPDAADRLVPVATPDSVVVCGYRLLDPTNQGGPDVPQPSGVPSSAVLSGDLGPIAADLTDLPRAGTDTMPCAAYSADTDDNAYLIGLRYTDGTVWVSAPGDHCAGASNGAFTTATNLGALSAAWLAAGHWVTSPSPYTNSSPLTPVGCPTAYGRLGQDTAMVPGSPTALTICVTVGAVSRVVEVPTENVAQVAAVLDAAPPTTRPTTGARCTTQLDATSATSYSLTFGYATGPGVRVSVTPGCTPAIDNTQLVASETSDLAPLLADLTR